MADSDDRFLSRWARRKRAARDIEETDPLGEAEHRREPEHGDSRAVGTPESSEAPLRPEDLPDPDTLDEGADFTVFLKDGVPEAIRQRALRRLWRLNPVFANLDGLNDYDQDYTDAATVVQGLKSLYQAGKGYLRRETAEDQGTGGETPEGPTGAPEPETETTARGTPGSETAATAEDTLAPGTTGTEPEEPAEPKAGAARAAAKKEPASVAVAKPAARRSARERRWGRESGRTRRRATQVPEQ